MRHSYGGKHTVMRSTTIAAAAAIALAGGLAVNASAGQRTSQNGAAPAPGGQTTVAGLLSTVSSVFSSADTGWTPYGATAVSQVSSVGHLATGALSVRSAGPWTGSVSPSFAATPGARYSATSWVMAASAGHGVGLALRFYDANGALLGTGTQVGQGATDSTSTWTPTVPVIGFAPAGATRGEVVFLDYDGAAGDVQWVDDVDVSRTTGTPAPLAAPLRTYRNQVLDRDGRGVTFHGIHLDGLEVDSARTVSPTQVAVARSWGANFVRVPLAEDFALPNDCGYDTGAYLSKVDALVDAATARHMFTLLDLHSNAVVPCAAPHQQAMPDQRALDFWQLVADRYKSNPLVGFDLFNEPHGVSDALWRDGGTVVSSGVTYATPGMQRLYDAVRATGASNLVFASGPNWASTFPASAPLRHTSNLVYAAHAYTCPTGTPQSGATCNPGPAGVDDPTGILDRFDQAARSVPVMVTEFGYPDRYDGRYIANLTSAVATRGWVGWDAFAFDGSNSGLFDLVKDTGPLWDPTVSGMAVMTAMLHD